LNIFRDAGDALKIWVAEKNGKIIAVLTVFYWNNLVTPFHTASLKDYFDCCPNNILHMEVIKDAINKNYRYYDFGPSGGEDGVVQFKQSFRAEKLFLVSGYWKPR
jgi:lipid II:glycine glycyltransferase (peptidoglycan interpeptide bridge formation enzyme)